MSKSNRPEGPSPRKHERSDNGDAFLPDPQGGPIHVRDELAERFGEGFVEGVTTAEDPDDLAGDAVTLEEVGGPFVETSASVELADGFDEANPEGAEREPFPTARKPALCSGPMSSSDCSPRSSSRALAILLFAGSALLAPACSASSDDTTPDPNGNDQTNGGFVVKIETDLAVPTQLDGFTIDVENAGTTALSMSFDAKTYLPAEITLRSQGVAHEGNLPSIQVGVPGDDVRISITGSMGGNLVVARIIETTLPGTLKLLDVPLAASCAQVLCGNTNDMTCVAGACVSSALDASTLPDQP